MIYLDIRVRGANHPYGHPGKWDVLLVEEDESGNEKTGAIVSDRPLDTLDEAMTEKLKLFKTLEGVGASVPCSNCNKNEATVAVGGREYCQSCAEEAGHHKLLLEDRR